MAFLNKFNVTRSQSVYPTSDLQKSCPLALSPQQNASSSIGLPAPSNCGFRVWVTKCLPELLNDFVEVIDLPVGLVQQICRVRLCFGSVFG